MPKDASRRQYQAYAAFAAAERATYFTGRLATYQYLNMDQVVENALQLTRRIVDERHAFGRQQVA